jgi:hypothetical protein
MVALIGLRFRLLLGAIQNPREKPQFAAKVETRCRRARRFLMVETCHCRL